MKPVQPNVKRLLYTMAGYVPVLLTPMVAPLFEVVAARTSVRKL
jgi:hypothetical protein